jgi:hypothetical protein
MGLSGKGLMMFVVWIACVLMVVAAALLVAGVGAAGLWIAVIAVAIVTVVSRETHRRHGFHS